MSDTNIIDWEQLEMIFGEEDEFDEDMAELYEEFLEDGKNRLDIIKGANFPDEKDLIAKESHKLKGSASNFGFAQMASLLGDIENDIDSITIESLQEHLSKAEAAFGESQQQVLTKYPAVGNN